MKDTCDYHTEEPVEAELVSVGELTWIQLRCPICERKRGKRLVRKGAQK